MTMKVAQSVKTSIVHLKNTTTTHILIPGDIGYNKSINYIKSRQMDCVISVEKK
jgi:hypothetical protein